VEGKIFLSAYFSFERHVLWVDIRSVFPESGELLDCLVLFNSVLFILEILDNDIRENSWNQKVKFFKLPNNVLSVNFVFENLPEILNDFFAMGVSCFSIHLLTILLRVL
jgi:hypothetical protein